jgi:hypothetical protein
MRCLFAFDRDDTVTSSPEKTGPVPVEWVRHLAHDTGHEVWATGNQKLKDEADLPGVEEMVDLSTERWGDPKEHFRQRSHPKLERREGVPADAPDPDVVTTLYLREDNPVPRGFPTDDSLDREQRLRLLAALFPDCDKRVVVDNKYLDHLDEWVHYYPGEFVEFVETLGPLLDVAEPLDVGVPDCYDWPDDRS